MALSRLAALLVLVPAAAVEASVPQRKPHVVFILADDYGWANMGAHRRGPAESDEVRQGQQEVRTPTLDLLVDEGVLLERHYSYKICSPSRSALQSGRLAVHVNSKNTGVTVRNVSDPVSGYAGIPRNMTGMAQKLRSAGYRTHMVGKWDAGMATPEHTPLGRGYESWTGYFQHANDYWRKNMPFQSTGEVDNCLNTFTDFFTHNSTYRGGVRDGVSTTAGCLEDPSSHPACYEENIFKERALSVVREHDTSKADAPLFLFYAFHLLHTPLQVPSSYLEKIDFLMAKSGARQIDVQNRRLYAAMTLYMDEAVGDLVRALKEKGMWNDTLVVFVADNGGALYMPGSGNNWPLKGGKYSDWEGGVRTNAFVSGGFVPPSKRGSSFSGVISIADWYGTLCQLVGVDPRDEAAEEANKWLKPRALPLLPPVDSVPQWDFMMNGTNGRPALHVSENALLRWPHKLVTGKQPYSDWTGPLYPNCTTVADSDADQGPVYNDLKIFNVVVDSGATQKVQDRLVWTQDCAAGCLFNVETDPQERHDLAGDSAFAGLLEELKRELRTLNEDIFQPGRGTPSLAACEMSVDNGGFYGPFLDVEGWYSPVPNSPGQYAKDAVLKHTLQVVNSEILQRGAIAAGEKMAPWLRQAWAKTLDKCLRESFVV